jgi:hypothetical protein
MTKEEKVFEQDQEYAQIEGELFSAHHFHDTELYAESLRKLILYTLKYRKNTDEVRNTAIANLISKAKNYLNTPEALSEPFKPFADMTTLQIIRVPSFLRFLENEVRKYDGSSTIVQVEEDPYREEEWEGIANARRQAQLQGDNSRAIESFRDEIKFLLKYEREASDEVRIAFLNCYIAKFDEFLEYREISTTFLEIEGVSLSRSQVSEFSRWLKELRKKYVKESPPVKEEIPGTPALEIGQDMEKKVKKSRNVDTEGATQTRVLLTMKVILAKAGVTSQSASIQNISEFLEYVSKFERSNFRQNYVNPLNKAKSENESLDLQYVCDKLKLIGLNYTPETLLKELK